MKVSLGGQSEPDLRRGSTGEVRIGNAGQRREGAVAFRIFYAGGDQRGSSVIHRVDGI